MQDLNTELLREIRMLIWAALLYSAVRDSHQMQSPALALGVCVIAATCISLLPQILQRLGQILSASFCKSRSQTPNEKVSDGGGQHASKCGNEQRPPPFARPKS